MASAPSVEEFPSSTLVVLVADLAGYALAFRTRSDAEMVRLLDRYYRVAEGVITESGGRVVKFMGDSVLAVYEESDGPIAVAAAVMLEAAVASLSRDLGFQVSLGVNVHLGSVIEAELGSGRTRRPDVFGRTVNQAFLLGRGPGIRISEPVYRKLPSGERTPWTRNRPPAVYGLGDDAGVYEGLRKAASENASRW